MNIPGRLQILWGIVPTPPVIAGFEIVARKRQWMLARQGIREFFIDRRSGGWRLFPRTQDGQARTDQAIFIPEDKA